MNETELFFNISSLFISAVTLGVTIYIPYLLNKMDKEKNKKENDKEILLKAKKFIQENSCELRYLSLCKIASSSYFNRKHKRDIYNEFTLLEDDVKIKVLELNKLPTKLIKESDDDWIKNKLEEIKKIIKKMHLSGNDTFIDENTNLGYGLTFNSSVIDESLLNDHLYQNFFDAQPMFYDQRGNLTFEEYIAKYFSYNTQEKEKNKMKRIILPIDYFKGIMCWDLCFDGKSYFYLYYIINLIMLNSCKYLNYSFSENVYTNAKLEYLEDYYFDLLYKLYYFS